MYSINYHNYCGWIPTLKSYYIIYYSSNIPVCAIYSEMNIHSVFSLQILYFIAMLCGAFPFYCSPKQPFANASFKYRVYSVVISIVISWLTYTSILSFLSITLSEAAIKEMRPLYMVYVMIVSVGFFKVIWLFIISQLNSQQFIRLIKDAFELYDHIKQLPKTSIEFATSNAFVRHRTSCLLSLRFGTLLAQTFSFFVSIPFVPIWLKVALTFQMFFRLFVNFLYSIQTTLLFAALFVMLKFYVHLNHRLQICMETVVDISNNGKKRSRTQKFCDVCDEIDRISRLYEDCRGLTEKFAALFSTQILLSVIHGGGMIISQLFFMYEAITLYVLDNQSAVTSVIKSLTMVANNAIEVWIMIAVAGAVTKEVCFKNLELDVLNEYCLYYRRRKGAE